MEVCFTKNRCTKLLCIENDEYIGNSVDYANLKASDDKPSIITKLENTLLSWIKDYYNTDNDLLQALIGEKDLDNFDRLQNREESKEGSRK